ncbi:hypothetical protein [Mixta intestinalis]|jgi:hypothetical protein|nr:hypothetical protein [Mixta intestinalis]
MKQKSFFFAKSAAPNLRILAVMPHIRASGAQKEGMEPDLYR